MTSSRTVPFTLHESITLCEFISEEKSIERKGTSVELRSDKSEAWTRVQTTDQIQCAGIERASDNYSSTK